jgi:tRNA threonylcarbamoyl adenosine modification protein YjeE
VTSYKQIALPDVDALDRVARAIATEVCRGDVITLSGDLGAGKTTFAQFLIAALSTQPVEVTSPTFTLLQTYPVILADGAAAELHHFDLYRIEHPSALIELGLEEALEHVALIEWPERLQGYHVPVTLALSLALTEDGGRLLTINGAPTRWKVLA